GKSEAQFIDAITGAQGIAGATGADGASAYEVWEAIPGNGGKTVADFIDSITGADGIDGQSAYEIWEALPGNTGLTQQDFITSLQGADGKDGDNVPLVNILEGDDALITGSDLLEAGKIAVAIALPDDAQVDDILTVNGINTSITQDMIDNGFMTSVDIPAEGETLFVKAVVTYQNGTQSGTGKDFARVGDTEAPVLTVDPMVINGPDDDGNGKPDSTTITGTTEAGAIVGVDINGDGKSDFVTIADALGDFKLTVKPALDKDQEVQVTATDAAGNSSEPQSVIGLGDTVAASEPIINVPIPSGSEGEYNENDLNVDGTVTVVVEAPNDAQLGDTLIVNGQEIILTWKVLGTGYSLDVQPGSTVTASIKDKVGNESNTATAAISIDFASPIDAPVITDNVANNGSGDVLTTPELIADGGITNDNTPSVVVPADQVANGTPQLVVNGTVVAADVTVNPDGSYTLTPVVALDDGEYTLSYNIKDTFDNVSGNAPTVTVTVDTVILITARDDLDNLDLTLQVTTSVPINAAESTTLEAFGGNNGADSDLSFTVSANTNGTVNIEVTENALVQVADAISFEIYNSNNELLYIAANANNPLVGNVAGLEVLGLTNNNGSLTATVSGLQPDDYKVVVSKDSSALETLINNLTVAELGEAGVVLGPDNQIAILDAVEVGLGVPLGPTVRLTLELALNLTTDIGVGEFLSIAQPILIAAGASLDPLLDAVAAQVLSNTLALLETTEVTATLTEYNFDNNTVATGNVINPEPSVTDESGEDVINPTTTLTTIASNNNLSSVPTPTQLNGVDALAINGEYGVLIIDKNGEYTYTANGDYASSGQSEVFTYTISDGLTSDTAELVIDLNFTIDMAAGDDIVNITNNILQSSLDGLDDSANTINIDAALNINIIGGEGFDTINLTGSGQTLSLSDILQTEVIDIIGTGANTLTIQAADITNSGTSSPIYVKGDSDDTVDLGGIGADLSDVDGANNPSTWVDAGTDVTDANGRVYNVWQLDSDTATQIYIDTNITTII
ncbi:Ig-like domain-containing protein, partial [Psychrobacter sp. APC 3350]